VAAVLADIPETVVLADHLQVVDSPVLLVQVAAEAVAAVAVTQRVEAAEAALVSWVKALADQVVQEHLVPALPEAVA
jgi:hypothetical protein